MTFPSPGPATQTTGNVAGGPYVAWSGTVTTNVIGPGGSTVPFGTGGGGVALYDGTNSITSGTAQFSNANGVTFGIVGQTITASIPAVGGAQTGISSIADSANTQTQGMLSFANSNGITFGLSTGANTATLTASYTVPLVPTSYVSQVNGSSGALSLAVGSSLSSSTNGSSITFGLASNITTALQSAGPYLTTARASNDAIGLNTAQSNVTWTVNSSGLSVDARGYAGTGTSATNASITLNSNGLAISVAPGGGGGFTGGVSTGGNTLGNTGTQTGQIIFAGGNNITLSVATAAGGAQTITISGANAGGAQTGISGIVVSNTTYTSGTVSFSNANGISFGSSAGQAITASYTVPTVTNSSWTVSDANTSATVGRLAFTQSNGLTLSLSTSNNGNHTVIGSYTVPSTAGLLSNINVSAGTTSANLSAVTFSNSNGLAFGLNAGTITGSYTVPTQSSQSAIKGLGVSNTGNTAGNTGLSTGIDWVLAGSNNITASQSTAAGGPNTVWFSGPTLTQYFSNTGTTFNGANISGSMTLNTNGLNLSLSGGAGGGGAAISAQGSSQNAGTIVFSNSNGVTFGMSGSTITATVQPGAAAGIAAINNSNTTYTSGTVQLTEGGGAITIASNTGQRFAFSVPQTSSLVGVSGISVSSAGSTISVQPGTMDVYVNLAAAQGSGSAALTNGSFSNGTLNLFPFNPAPQLFPAIMTIDRFGMLWSANHTNTSQSTQAFSSTFAMGIYTQVNATQLSRLYSGTFTTQGTANAGNSSLLNGVRWITIAASQWDTQPVLSQGNYWGGMLALTGGTSIGASSVGPIVARAGVSNALSGFFGAASASAASNPNRFPFDGYLSVSTAGLPASVALSDVIFTGSGYAQMVPLIAALGSGKSGAFGIW